MSKFDWRWEETVQAISDLLKGIESARLLEVMEQPLDRRIDVVAVGVVEVAPYDIRALIHDLLHTHDVGADHIGAYSPETLRLLPLRWFHKHYSNNAAVDLFESIHLGRKGWVNALVGWALAGYDPNAVLEAECHVVQYPMVLSASAPPEGRVVVSFMTREEMPTAPVGHIMPGYKPRGDTVVPSHQVITVSHHLNVDPP